MLILKLILILILTIQIYALGEYMGEFRGRESPPKNEALVRRLHELNQLTARVLDDEDVLSSSSENTDL